jgi:hypothetical protein
MTFSIITFSIMTFSIMTFSIMAHHKVLNCGSQHKRHSITTLYHYAECHFLFVVMMNVVMLSIVALLVKSIRHGRYFAYSEFVQYVANVFKLIFVFFKLFSITVIVSDYKLCLQPS